MSQFAEVQKLKGKVAIVTGGSQGIGAGIAIELARAGADVCINYIGDAAPAEEVASQVRALGRKAFLALADVSDRASVEKMFVESEKELGPASIVVTNAIYSTRQSLLETDFAELQKTVGVGIYGVFHCMQIGARRMVELGIKGSIIHITSPHAKGPFKNAIDYNIAKSGAHQLALSAANELMWKGIRVNLIEPGWTVTPGELKFYTKPELEDFGHRMPLGRMEYPDDLGRAAVFLCSDDAAYIAGAHLKVDGGQFIEGGPSWEAVGRHV